MQPTGSHKILEHSSSLSHNLLSTSLRTRSVLALLVLVAHVLVLHGTPVALSVNEPLVVRPIATRTVAPVALNSIPVLAQESLAAPRVATPKPISKQSPKPKSAAQSKPVDPAATDTSSAGSIATGSSETPTEAKPPTETIAKAPEPSPQPAPEAAPPDNAVVRKVVLPASARLKYNVTGEKSGLTYSANAELRWRHDGTTYDLSTEVSAFLVGSRVETSKGRLLPQGLAPMRFSQKTRSEQAAHLDYDKARITFSNAASAALLTGAQDRISLMIQLGGLLAGEPDKYPVGTSLSIQTVGPRAAEMWVIKVEETELLHLPGGNLQAIKLVRLPRQEFDQKAEIWLAPAQGYLPVRIRITSANGDFVDQQWRSTETP